MRYMCLSYVMTMSSISPPVKKRFPNLSKMLEAGLDSFIFMFIQLFCPAFYKFVLLPRICIKKTDLNLCFWPLNI